MLIIVQTLHLKRECSLIYLEWDKKMKEFEMKYPVPETLKFVQQHLDVAGKFAISSEPSSSFQVVCSIMHRMAATYGCSLKEDVPEVWKMIINIMATCDSSTYTQGMVLTYLSLELFFKEKKSSKPKSISSLLNNLGSWNYEKIEYFQH